MGLLFYFFARHVTYSVQTHRAVLRTEGFLVPERDVDSVRGHEDIFGVETGTNVKLPWIASARHGDLINTTERRNEERRNVERITENKNESQKTRTNEEFVIGINRSLG